MSMGSIVEEPIEVLLEKQDIESDSSVEPPMEEWSSLDRSATPSLCQKRRDYDLGLYDPGSGEICAKYVAQSDSSVLGHVYYAYPCIKDPGIIQALTLPEPKYTYDTCGQELYLDLCKEAGLAPMRTFHQSLTEPAINLRYYGVNPMSVRMMCQALALNRYVTRLDLTSNFLDNDACYHLGQLLKENMCLTELVLAQCRIGPSGMERLAVHLHRRTMQLLDLSSNALGDDGLSYLATSIRKRGVIKRLNLSYNELSVRSSIEFSEAIEINNTITHLDLSWNRLFQPASSNRILNMLSISKVLTELNFSWNNLTTTTLLGKILTLKNLYILDLSNNRLGHDSVKSIVKNLQKAKKLNTLDLSYNPFGPEDARMLLEKMMEKSVKLEKLLMTGILINKNCMEVLQTIKSLPHRQNTVITHGNVVSDYTLTTVDMRDIVLKRLNYCGFKGSKKNPVDLCLLLMQEHKDRGQADFMTIQEMSRALKSVVPSVEDNIIEEMGNLFPGPKVEKAGRSIRLGMVVEYIHRLWPEKVLPPTPVEEPPPPPPKKDKKKKK